MGNVILQSASPFSAVITELAVLSRLWQCEISSGKFEDNFLITKSLTSKRVLEKTCRRDKELLSKRINCTELMRPTFKLVPDFILPNLENATYGRHLKWEDKRRGSFKVSRIHQNSEHWSDDCISVYKAWSLKKRLWKLDDPKRVTKAKHRLITALRRNPIVEVLTKEPAYYRFRLTDLKSSEKQGMHSLIDIDQSVPNSSGRTKETDALVEKLEEDKCEIYSGCFPTAYGKQLTDNVCVDHAKIDAEKSVSSEFSCTIVYEIESDNPFQSSFAASEVPSENGYSENDSWSSGKCCCKVLLDSTLLCNEMCIWHGVSS